MIPMDSSGRYILTYEEVAVLLSDTPVTTEELRQRLFGDCKDVCEANRQAGCIRRRIRGLIQTGVAEKVVSRRITPAV